VNLPEFTVGLTVLLSAVVCVGSVAGIVAVFLVKHNKETK